MAEAVRKDPKYSATAQSSFTKKGGSAASNSQGSATAVKSTPVKVLIDGQIIIGYMVNGKTTVNGTKVTNPLGTFTMIGGKGVLDTKSTNKVADTAKDFGKGFVNGAVDTALAPVMLVLNAPEVISQMQKNLQTKWQQPNPTDSKGRTTRTAVFLAQARNSQETYSNYLGLFHWRSGSDSGSRSRCG